jgi:hypothetical protein
MAEKIEESNSAQGDHHLVNGEDSKVDLTSVTVGVWTVLSPRGPMC